MTFHSFSWTREFCIKTITDICYVSTSRRSAEAQIGCRQNLWEKKMSPDNECTVVLFRKGLFLKWDSKDTRGNQETPNEDVDDVSQCSYIIETQKDITQVNERLATKYMMLHNLRTTKRICNPEQKKHKSLKYHSLWLKTCVCLFDRVWPWVSEAGCLEFWADFIPYLVKSSSRLTSESDLVSFIQWRQLQFNSHSAWVVTGCDQSFRFIWPVQYVIKHTQANVSQANSSAAIDMQQSDHVMTVSAAFVVF